MIIHVVLIIASRYLKFTRKRSVCVYVQVVCLGM